MLGTRDFFTRVPIRCSTTALISYAEFQSYDFLSPYELICCALFLFHKCFFFINYEDYDT